MLFIIVGSYLLLFASTRLFLRHYDIAVSPKYIVSSSTQLFTKQDLISNNKIADFILKSRGNFVVDSAVSEIVKREFKLSGNMPAKNN